MPTLLEYFINDFKDLSINGDLTATVAQLNEEKEILFSKKVIIKRSVRQSHISSCKLLTFYIPKVPDTLSLIGNILDKLEEHIIATRGIGSIGGYENDVQVGNHESVYSKRIYFYTECSLTSEEVKRLENYCKEKNIFVTLRSSNYINTRLKNEKPLAFISHDSRDKEIIAKRLADGLSTRLCSVWYDEYSLKPGQSLRETIESGIKNAKKCILVLTPNFLANPGWTKKEFNSIFTREMIFQERLIIPIWHNVKKEEIYEYSPSLADTFALTWPDSSKLGQIEYDREVERLISKIHTSVTE
jgi:hypothetical protein